jgi:hypothetical protein
MAYNKNLVTTTNSDQVLNFYNHVYDDINKFNLDKENAISNIYVYKKTKMINKIFYMIISVCVIIIILTFINKTFKYFDDVAYLIICGVFVGTAFVYIGYLLWDLYFRDNLNFDEYDYNKFGTTNPPKMSSHVNKGYSDISFNDISGNVKCESLNKENTIKSIFTQLF